MGGLRPASALLRELVGKLLAAPLDWLTGLCLLFRSPCAGAALLMRASNFVFQEFSMTGHKTLKMGLIAAALIAGAASTSWAQPVAGTTTLGVAATEVQAVATGWSLKKSVLGKSVYNEEGKAVGKIDDVIVAPDKAVSYAIIGAGGFLGLGKHDVAIPVNQFRVENNKITLPGATKDALKALPKFEYAKK